MGRCKHGIEGKWCAAYGCPGYQAPHTRHFMLVKHLPKTQADRVLNAITDDGVAGTNHDSLATRLGMPLASVRRVTQQLRKAGKIRYSHFDRGGNVIFVAAHVPVLFEDII